MTLVETAKGANASSAVEATLNEITSDDFAYWGAMVFIPTTPGVAFTTGDKVEIRFWAYSSQLLAMKPLYYRELIGSTSYNEESIYIPPVQTKRYKLTIKRTLGVDRTWAWHITRQSG